MLGCACSAGRQRGDRLEVHPWRCVQVSSAQECLLCFCRHWGSGDPLHLPFAMKSPGPPSPLPPSPCCVHLPCCIYTHLCTTFCTSFVLMTLIIEHNCKLRHSMHPFVPNTPRLYQYSHVCMAAAALHSVSLHLRPGLCGRLLPLQQRRPLHSPHCAVCPDSQREWLHGGLLLHPDGGHPVGQEHPADLHHLLWAPLPHVLLQQHRRHCLSGESALQVVVPLSVMWVLRSLGYMTVM